MKNAVGRGGPGARPPLPPLGRPLLWLAAVAWIAAGCTWLSGPLPPWHAPRLAPLLTAPPGLAPPFSSAPSWIPSGAASPPLEHTNPTASQAALPPPILASQTVTQVIGYSHQGLPLEAYRFGDGPRRVALIGGLHGGYEWNTILLAYRVIDYLAAHPEAVPPALTVYVIPAANPDGQMKGVGRLGRFAPEDVVAEASPGRFNGAGVDLNRNWACNWTPVGLWRTTEVSGGTAAMSEPETQAIAAFVTQPPMAGVLFWHSAANAVFAGGCNEPFPPAIELARVYSEASGYPYLPAFTAYVVTGDAADWLADQGIPAIEIELISRERLDWEQNRRGVLALLAYWGTE